MTFDELLKTHHMLLSEEDMKIYDEYLKTNLPYKIGDLVYINPDTDSLHDVFNTDELNIVKDIIFEITGYSYGELIDYFKSSNRSSKFIYYARPLDNETNYSVDCLAHHYSEDELLPVIINNVIDF